MKRPRKGFTLIELLICIAIILVIGAMVIPRLMDAMKAANETSALQSIRTIHTSQTQFYSLHHRHAKSLEELRAVSLAPSLLDGQHSGYLFKLELAGPGYVLTARPETMGRSGIATYFSDESLVVRVSRTSDPAGPDSSPVE